MKILKKIILGEIVVAEIVKHENGLFSFECPAGIILKSSLGKYTYESDAIAGAKFLVPANCREFLQVQPV